jgi:hypothetical protein
MANSDSVFDPADEISSGGGIERPDLAAAVESRGGGIPNGHWLNVRTAGSVVGIEAAPEIVGEVVFFFGHVDDFIGIKEYFDREIAAAENAFDSMVKEGFAPRTYFEGVA